MVTVLNAEVSLIETCQEASAIGVSHQPITLRLNQIVIGGEVAAVDKAVELWCRSSNPTQYLDLSYGTLRPASERLAEVLETVEFSDFVWPLVEYK